MATNGDNIPAAGDTEMAECDGEEVVTMMDVLREQQDFEDDANAVLGGSDEKECTYAQGYIKRQAIYACMTCCPESTDDPSKRAGFCLACSLTCHENHDLVELYTKRNFRCDCGNPKFKSPCQFTPNKPDLNDENVYNQNFIGLYCICNKPYGEQESNLDDEMIQCIVCEDWWHASHLDAVVPPGDQYAEMICKLCMAKNQFLHDYSELTVNIETGDVDVVKVNGVDSMMTDDTLINGSVTDGQLAPDDKLTNGTEENISSDGMEISSSEIKITDKLASDNEVSSTEKENTEPEKLDETVSGEKPVEDDQNIKTNEALMETNETDEATKVLPEVSSEDKLVTENPEDANKLSEDKAEEPNETPKITEAGTPESKPDEICETSLEKPNDDAKVSTTGTAETQATEVKENTETSVQSKSETLIGDSISADTEVSSDKVKEDREIEAKIEVVQDSATTASCTAEIDTSNADSNSPPSENTPDRTAEIDKTNADASSLPSENTSDKNKATETSQEDEEMTDLCKDNKQVSNDTQAKDNDIKTDAKTDDPKESECTNNIESNVTIVPELALTEKRKLSTEDVTDDNASKKLKLDDSKCVRPKGVKKVHKGATFWPSSFRQKLCTCSECLSMYKDMNVLFLTDLEDTVFAYETLGKEKTAGKPSQYEKGIEALCSLGRVQQIDALTEYNKMRDKLLTFLQNFKDRKEIVTEHDIRSFFAGMKPEKRTDGVYFCG